tara:strand:+ start:495 stop:689 length:195 start_codon:yes stop_codon:yes gene_type:complete
MKKTLLKLHWLGFFITIFMLSLSFLDPSQDEAFIHFFASSFPLLVTWIIRVLNVGPVPIFPFLR